MCDDGHSSHSCPSLFEDGWSVLRESQVILNHQHGNEHRLLDLRGIDTRHLRLSGLESDLFLYKELVHRSSLVLGGADPAYEYAAPQQEDAKKRRSYLRIRDALNTGIIFALNFEASSLVARIRQKRSATTLHRTARFSHSAR